MPELSNLRIRFIDVAYVNRLYTCSIACKSLVFCYGHSLHPDRCLFDKTVGYLPNSLIS